MSPRRLLKRILPASLFGRSLLIMATPLLLTLAIGTFVFFDRHWSTTTDRLAMALAGEINIVANTIDQQSGEITKWQRQNFENNFQLVINYDPEAVFSYSKSRMKGLPGLRQSFKDALHERLEQRPFSIHTGKLSKDNVLIIVGLKKGVLHVEASRKRLFSTTTYIFLIWMIGAGFILFTIALLFMRNQVRPIRRLAYVAEQFGKGHDVTYFKIGGAREVRQAAEAFVLMRERIKRQIQQRTEMLAGVSHDLRTPLTRMNLQLAMMPPSTETQSLQQDIQIMRQMVDEYLAFARGATSEVSLHADLLNILQQAIHHSEALGLHVHYSTPDWPILLKIRPQAISRLFGNILQNALAYAGDKKNKPAVWVTVNKTPEHVELLFDDNGPGIAADQREDVFRPFVRLEESRNKETGGVGLGLAIARDVVQSHGGAIDLQDAPQGGLRVRIELPL
jgi:two-component system osmolarity sensor histidine kinase EnvZ